MSRWFATFKQGVLTSYNMSNNAPYTEFRATTFDEATEVAQRYIEVFNKTNKTEFKVYLVLPIGDVDNEY